MRPTYHEHELFRDAPVLGNVYRLGRDVESHGHDFCEIAIIGGGTGRHVTAHGTREVRRGDVFVLRPGAWHGFVRCRNLTVANCCISASSLHAELRILRDLPAIRDLLWHGPHRPGSRGLLSVRVSPERADAAIAEISGLEAELDSGLNSGGAELGTGLDSGGAARPIALLGRLLKILSNVVDDGTRSREHGQAPRAHRAVATAIDLLESSPERPWQLDELSNEVNLDPAYLSRLFRRDVGLSPIAYLARIRAEKAATLLARTEEPAARIGGLVGWPDPTYFARRFRTLIGLTPIEYRRRTRDPRPVGRPLR